MVVLLLYWEEDDLNVKCEVDALRQVFKVTYHFETETYIIPPSKSHIMLMGFVVEFVTHWESDFLIIVYYAGHGSMNDARQSTLVW